MSAALATTCCMLLWCFALSISWAFICFYWVVRASPQLQRLTARVSKPAAVTLPALVVAPLLLVLAYRAAHLNLLAPVHLFASPLEVASAALAPAIVLLLASGIGTTLASSIQREYHFWLAQPCARLVASLGASVPKALRRVVIIRALSSTWSQCLPWLYGELIVVEAVFNAPGLGLDAWHFARIRDHANLLTVMLWLAVLYGLSVALSTRVHTVLGRKLASYA